jgi:hypothetical protein
MGWILAFTCHCEPGIERSGMERRGIGSQLFHFLPIRYRFLAPKNGARNDTGSHPLNSR